MDEALLSQLTGLGLPDGMTDPNQIMAWLIGKLQADAEEESAEPMDVPQSTPVTNMNDPQVADPKSEVGSGATDPNKVMKSQAEALIKRALELDQKRRTEIQAACKLGKVERSFADELCDGNVPLSDARKRIIERMATQPLGNSVGGDVRVTQSSDDKFYAAARDGLLMRCQNSAKIRRTLVEGEKPADGAEDFRQLNLTRIAEAFMRRQNAPVERMSNAEIAQAAMGNERILNKYRVQRADFGAYHTTGSFSNLMLDAAHKTLLAGYEEAPYTWSLWARQAASVEDFKNINRIRFSEAPNPEAVPEGHDYPEKTMSDSKETYAVGKYGESFSVSWETVIGDDLDALSRIPTMHGNAMRRLQNKKVYEVLTGNPTMGDGNALFSSAHTSGDNTSGAAAAPSVTTLNAGFVKMMLQKGLASDAILNIQPRFLIVPVNYAATALQLTASLSDPLAGGSTTTGNANTLNIYGPSGIRPIQVIVEPQLDGSSSTNWYLAADNGQVDTVELTFLAGEESPVLESEWNLKNDTWLYKIRQTFAAKAIDWRGLYRNA
jgi:hypothetical protein